MPAHRTHDAVSLESVAKGAAGVLATKGEPLAKPGRDGLTFKLPKGGTASWVLRYRIGEGRRKELSIRNYPNLILAAARKKARSSQA
jgi:hypothetical protein